ncbi:MAG: hypothetical protein BYD32DRAFT_470690 [Podila humilis]|nr:MAG: hypothetical protein BYD32DRAFT_470690 [Podila humilis]
MLLLVPSNKDEDGSGKAMSPTRGRVLVVLPPDTDLSSNVIVPDAAITNTLITNEALDPANVLASPQLSMNKLSYIEPTQTRDPLGIIQPQGPESIYQHIRLQYEQTPTITTQPNSQGREDTNHRRSIQYPSAEDTISRARRHSHSGLVEMDHPIFQALARSRSKLRSSFSQATPYQHQRTLRALRTALKKGRKDQSPLLTSASFGTDYGQSCFDDEIDDPFSEWRAQQHHNAIRQAMGHSPELVFGSSFGHLSSESELSSDSLNTKLAPRRPSISNDIEIDKEDHLKTTGAQGTKRQLHDSQEDIDIVGVSDEEMEPPKSEMMANQGPTIVPRDSWRTPSLSPEDKNRSLGETDTYDADMDLILGMASDMDLVMPQFDDEYLDDLNNDPSLLVQIRRVPSISTSPVTSHSSSTTITCISSLHSPSSRSMTPGVCVESTLRQESPPTSPATIEARKRSGSSSVKGQMPMMGNMNSPHSTENTQAGQDLSTIHRDIDNLKRHRDSLQSNIEMITSPPKGLPTPSSSSSSSNSSSHSRAPSSDKRSNPQAPLYFKPTHHSQPSGDHSHQNVMIIQSNQWTFDSDQLQQPGLVGRIPLQSPTHAVRGNDGNHIFSVRESSPPSPPPVLDKSAIMTTNNISLATANMNVLTPREVQEDYYVKRNIQRMYQRNRRRSSTGTASALSAAAASVATPPFRLGPMMPQGPLNSTIPLPLRRGSISPDGPHPLDKFGVATVMVMGNPLPASYYIPPSAFRTEATVAAEKEAERKRREEEELKDSFLVFPSPTLS